VIQKICGAAHPLTQQVNQWLNDARSGTSGSATASVNIATGQRKLRRR
jgi:hypothetical protein